MKKFAYYQLLILTTLFSCYSTRGTHSHSAKKTVIVERGSANVHISRALAIAIALGGSSSPSNVTKKILHPGLNTVYLSQFGGRAYYYGGVDDNTLPSSALICEYDIEIPDQYFDLWFDNQTKVTEIDYPCDKATEYCCDDLDCCQNCTSITCYGKMQRCCSTFDTCCPVKPISWWTYLLYGLAAFMTLLVIILICVKCCKRRASMQNIQTVQIVQPLPQQQGAMITPYGTLPQMQPQQPYFQQQMIGQNFGYENPKI